MTADVINFPARRSSCVWMLLDDGHWLVVAGEHGWAHGSSDNALRDATWLSDNLRLPIRVST